MKKDLLKRFEEKIEMIPECGCWIWIAAVQGDGYGVIKTGHKNKQSVAHRISWQLYRGSIPKGILVLHKCDTPACVNPYHLFLGTHKDNTQDMIKKNRKALQKGEGNNLSKLTECEVLTIRESCSKNINLSKIYKVNASTISRIKSRDRWKHV